MKYLIILLLILSSCTKEEDATICGTVKKSYLKMNEDNIIEPFAEVDFNGEIRLFNTKGKRLKVGEKYCIK